MDRLYVFLVRNDIWIYVLCGLGAIWYFAELIRARRQLRGAMFGLERERGQMMQRRAAIFVFLFTAVIAAVVYVNLEVAPTLPEELLKPPTPTPNIFVTPFASPSLPAESLTRSASDDAIAPTVTLPGDISSPAGTQEPAEEIEETPEATVPVSPEVEVGDCSPEVTITAPPSGITITGSVTFFGSVNPEEFEFYDLQIFGPETGDRWISQFDVLPRQPVIDDIIVTVDFQGWESGSYFVSLIATASDGLEVGRCTIQLALE